MLTKPIPFAPLGNMRLCAFVLCFLGACTGAQSDGEQALFRPADCSALERCAPLTSENLPGGLYVVPVQFSDRPSEECVGCYLATAQFFYKTWNTSTAEMATVLRRGLFLEHIVDDVWAVDLGDNDAAVFCVAEDDGCHCVGFATREDAPVDILLGPWVNSTRTVFYDGSAPAEDDITGRCPSLAN